MQRWGSVFRRPPPIGSQCVSAPTGHTGTRSSVCSCRQGSPPSPTEGLCVRDRGGLVAVVGAQGLLSIGPGADRNPRARAPLPFPRGIGDWGGVRCSAVAVLPPPSPKATLTLSLQCPAEAIPRRGGGGLPWGHSSAAAYFATKFFLVFARRAAFGASRQLPTAGR